MYQHRKASIVKKIGNFRKILFLYSLIRATFDRKEEEDEMWFQPNPACRSRKLYLTLIIWDWRLPFCKFENLRSDVKKNY